MEEQIAGLLHEVAVKGFSQTRDVLCMGGMNKVGYHDKIHGQFLNNHGVTQILERYKMAVDEILPDLPEFRCLEQPHPGLCADRIQYILNAADLEELMTSADIKKTQADLQFNDENWYFNTQEIAEKFSFI